MVSVPCHMDGFGPLSLSATRECGTSKPAWIGGSRRSPLSPMRPMTTRLPQGRTRRSSASIGVSSLPLPSLPDPGNLCEGPPGAAAKSVTR
jgi:hypothetical protein